MRITTTYFGPLELKNLNITSSRVPTAYVTHCHSAWPTVALVVNRANCNCLIHIQLRLIMDTYYGHMYMRCHSAVQTTGYNTTTIDQIAIVLFLFKVRL